MDFSNLQKVDEGVYLKRGKLWGTRCIYPIKNEDGKMNMFNLFTGGSWGNVISVAIICLFLIGSVYAYKHDMRACADALNYAVKNPCEWCNMVHRYSPASIIDAAQLQQDWANLFNASTNITG